MDILSPELLWLDNRCYRLPSLNSKTFGNNTNLDERLESESYIENFEEEDNAKDTCESEILIEAISESRYKLQLPVPSTFWPKIIGTKGVTKKRIENDTKTRISIPRPLEHGNIEIRGSSKRDIILAKKCIDDIVSSSRQRLTFTHFISLPMNGEEIKKNFIKFKEHVIKLHGEDRGIDESIFQSPNKLHLTIGTLILTDHNERKFAESELNKVYTNNIKPLLDRIKEKPKIELKGIEYMNDDPAEVDVLYAKISSETNLLQEIADSILRHFAFHKLIKTENREHVKLHVTLMNTLFRQEELEEVNEESITLNQNKGSKKIRSTFNAVNILKDFQNYYFGQQDMNIIELSVRFSTSKSGYYKYSCVLNL